MDYSSTLDSYDFYSTTTIPSTDTYSAAAVGTVLGMFTGIVLIIALVIAIIQIIAMWKLYTKAGEKGWNFTIIYFSLSNCMDSIYRLDCMPRSYNLSSKFFS